MSTILYGGNEETVRKQMKCKHDWHGPCIDDLSRYNKCRKCYAIERDMAYNRWQKDAAKVEFRVPAGVAPAKVEEKTEVPVCTSCGHIGRAKGYTICPDCLEEIFDTEQPRCAECGHKRDWVPGFKICHKCLEKIKA